MPKYTQTVSFHREFVINAKDANAANEKLEALINDVESDSDVQNDGFYDFEDEPVQCPKCKGACYIGDDDDQPCDNCNAEGCVPFSP